jgi:hypothetical protein
MKNTRKYKQTKNKIVLLFTDYYLQTIIYTRNSLGIRFLIPLTPCTPLIYS